MFYGSRLPSGSTTLARLALTDRSHLQEKLRSGNILLAPIQGKGIIITLPFLVFSISFEPLKICINRIGIFIETGQRGPSYSCRNGGSVTHRILIFISCSLMAEFGHLLLMLHFTHAHFGLSCRHFLGVRPGASPSPSRGLRDTQPGPSPVLREQMFEVRVQLALPSNLTLNWTKSMLTTNATKQNHWKNTTLNLTTNTCVSSSTALNTIVSWYWNSIYHISTMLCRPLIHENLLGFKPAHSQVHCHPLYQL